MPEIKNKEIEETDPKPPISFDFGAFCPYCSCRFYCYIIFGDNGNTEAVREHTAYVLHLEMCYKYMTHVLSREMRKVLEGVRSI